MFIRRSLKPLVRPAPRSLTADVTAPTGQRMSQAGATRRNSGATLAFLDSTPIAPQHSNRIEPRCPAADEQRDRTEEGQAHPVTAAGGRRLRFPRDRLHAARPLGGRHQSGSRGRHGRRACRLVRRGRAVSPCADPDRLRAHRDHSEEQTQDRRQPRGVRAGQVSGRAVAGRA